VTRGPEESVVAEATASCGLSSPHATQLADSIRKLFTAAHKVEARSLEINPLVLTKDGQFVAADCRITIDDYAVARHPELKIEIAREFDHPPTPLERVRLRGWNKTTIAAHFISRSWPRRQRKIPKAWLVFTAPVAADR